MGLTELLFIAIGLSMDAFAVAICKGLSMKKASLGKMVIVGLYFGIFQALMPLVGYLVGMQFERYITSIDHWIAFILLAVIGFNMIREALKGGDGEKEEADLGLKAMLPLALATSIDALAVGVTFAFLQTDIVPAVSFIGIITFTLSAVGVKIGNLFGGKLKNKAEIFGGVILIAIGLKILLEHLGVF